MNKNLFKKVISIILVIAMMASMAVYASAADETYTDDEGILTYTLSIVDGEGVASVKGNDSSITTVTIPSTITVDEITYTVTSLDYQAFYIYYDLVSVVLPETITTIGEQAFVNCKSLESINLPNSITTIGGWAFQDCVALKALDLPDSLTSFGTSAFYGCESLTIISIPVGVTVITDNSFATCYNLKEVIFEGNNVTTIEAVAFEECTSLETITIPDSVATIGNYAFQYCTSLTTITIPESVTKLNEGVFRYCTNLADIYISDTIDYIACSNFNDTEIERTLHYAGTQAQWDTFVNGELSTDDKLGFDPFDNDYFTIDCTETCEDCEDSDSDGCCDICGILISLLADYDFTNGGRCYWPCCGCICNASTWFGQILGEICLYFWELFGTHKWCQCGRMHY